MKLRTMSAALAAIGLGGALLAQPALGQTDPNAAAATAPKPTSDTAPAVSEMRRKPSTATAPSSYMLRGTASEMIGTGKLKAGKGQQTFR